MEKILVSICTQTYNHESYISQCLEGFVMQKTNFAYEILIHEDASTDNTAKIVKQYEQKYPDLFRCVYQTENQFNKLNSLTDILFPMAKGKYIAICEGDDYWTDPLKLQKQVNFLEIHSEFALSFHNVMVEYADQNKNSHPSNPKYDNDIFTIYDLIRGERFQTLSCLFRRGLFNKLPDWFYKSPAGDIILHILNASNGKIKYFPEIMGVYRVHKNGYWSSIDEHSRIKNHITILELLLSHPFEETVSESLKMQYINKTFTLYKHYFSRKDYEAAFSVLDNTKKIVQMELIDNITWLHNEYVKLRNSTSFKLGNKLVGGLKKVKINR